jgi:lipoprotein-anchoring transpeptidase ErfK/SrfK
MQSAVPARVQNGSRLPAYVWPVLAVALAATPAFPAELTAEAINSAELSGKTLSTDKPSPLVVRLEVLLDRAHFSPGEIDGKFGENAKKALRAYAEAHKLESSGQLTDQVWKSLENDDSAPVLANYTIDNKDISGPFLRKLPHKMEDMKDLPHLGYTSPQEALAEKFHMSEQLLLALNPGQHFDRPGTTIVVADTAGQNAEPALKAARVEIDKSRQTVELFDRSNNLIGFYPATIGSEEKPSPSGRLKVTAIQHNPTYHYDPKYHFKGVHAKKPFTIRPGPNNPVGIVWINLSAEGYGIHGTPEPAKVSKAQSHGCVRLTNWDAERVASELSKGTPVDFVDHSRSAGAKSGNPS